MHMSHKPGVRVQASTALCSSSLDCGENAEAGGAVRANQFFSEHLMGLKERIL